VVPYIHGGRVSLLNFSDRWVELVEISKIQKILQKISVIDLLGTITHLPPRPLANKGTQRAYVPNAAQACFVNRRAKYKKG
jgi:hypothetical protein